MFAVAWADAAPTGVIVLWLIFQSERAYRRRRDGSEVAPTRDRPPRQRAGAASKLARSSDVPSIRRGTSPSGSLVHHRRRVARANPHT